MIVNLNEIKLRLDPLEVLNFIGYSKSRPQKKGTELRDACPVHGGENLNLSINKNGEWYCHSRGCKGGDLISLYRQSRNVDFKTAVRELAGHFGIPVEDSQSRFSQGDRGYQTKQGPSKRECSDKAQEFARSKLLAAEAWSKAEEGNGHPYFDKKGVEPPPGVRYGKDAKGYPAVVVPFRNVEGDIQSIQYVQENGKIFLKDTKMEKAFFNIGPIAGPTVVYLCEGMATAISVWMGLNKSSSVFSCGGAHNISKVLNSFKRKYPDVNIVVCLDDDAAGLKSMQEVSACGLKGISFRKPDFTGLKRGMKDKDFNDLHKLAGISAVKEQLQKENTSTSQEKPKTLQLKPICEMPIDYLAEKPLEKPQLLWWHDDKGAKKAFLHKEVVAMLVAEGGAGKTHLLALLALCVVTGIPFLTRFIIKNPGPVCFLVGENNDGDLHRLIWKMHKYLQGLLDKNAKRDDGHNFSLHYDKPLEKIRSRFYPFSVHGMEASFIDKTGKQTPFYEALLEELKAKEPEEGWQLIILDPLSRFAGSEAEKDNAMATAYITCAERLSASLKGNPTILLSHHKSKEATGREESGQTAGRGSSAFTDGVRWQANLDVKKGEPGVSIFYLSKTNFTAMPPKFTVRKNFEGIPEFDKWNENP